MSERAEFLKWVESELREAVVAIHNGDGDPRRAIWSTQDPVTLFGAWNRDHVRRSRGVFRRLEQDFSDCTSYVHEIVSADAIGDLAYTVGYEHTSVSVNGEPRTYTLRVTQLYRREAGTWKVFHRHGDTLNE